MKNNKQTFSKKKLPAFIHMASGLSLMMGSFTALPALAQDQDANVEEVMVTGQRKSLQSAQIIKQNSTTIVDSIVAEDIGKLPDRSVTEALQRVPGITVSRYDDVSDPEHFAGEGAGVAVRGLTQVRAELNGRDVFSANDGRSLSFDDVPAELMYGVDTYKSPSADMIEGGLGGTVNLRTRMPFDADGQVAGITIKANYGDQIKETNGEYSGLYSNRWDTAIGDVGFLVDISSSELASRADNVYNRAFMPRTDIPGKTDTTVYVPKGSDWRRNDYHREREGQYLAFQWAPNEETEVYLTGFRSKHKQRWDENAYFLDGTGGSFAQVPVPGNNDWQYAGNVLQSGTIATAGDFGVSFGTSTRFSEGTATTTDYAGGVKWSPDEHWNFNADVQYVTSEATKDDLTLGLVVYPDTIRVDNLGGLPDISIDTSYLSDAGNYSFGQMQSMPIDNDADATTFKVDGEFLVDDSIIKSVKAGVRYTDKSAENRQSFQWSARYQPWQTGWQYPTTADIPKITDAQAEKYLTLYSFDNFYRGDINVPSSAYLIKSSALNDIKTTIAGIAAETPGGVGTLDWDNILNLNNPDNINTQKETTAAAYIMVKYGFDDLAMPVSGNLGVRVVQTDNSAKGQLKYPTFSLPAEGDASGAQPFYRPVENFEAKNSYTNVLPSLNVKVQATDQLVFRFAASEAIWRPEFWRMKALYNLNAGWKEGIDPTTDWSLSDINLTLDSGGANPYLEPIKATQYDLAAEWYFDDHGGMLYATLFTKDLKDLFQEDKSSTIISDAAYGDLTFNTSWTLNQGTADIDGIEIGVTKFFDFLPEPFDGFGINANYTYIDSKTKTPLTSSAIDTDLSTYGDLPYPGISENSYNLIAMYEKDGISARLAYNWRSKYLVTVGPNGWKDDGAGWFLPIYNDDYGQLDASIGYTFLDNYTVSFDVYNLTKEVTKGIMDQNAAGENYAYFYSQDVRYSLGLRANF